MWDTLTSHIPALIAGATALAAAVGAWLKLRPRRIVGWLAAVKERETLLAMYENEKAWGLYWRSQARECLESFQKEFRTEAAAEVDEVHAIAWRDGGGPIFSDGADGQTPTERLTG